MASSPMSGWAFGAGPKTRHRSFGRRIGPLLLLLPLVFGIVGAPGSAPAVHGDELSDARARQARIRKDVEAQRAQVRRLQALQTNLADDIQATAKAIRALNADQGALSKKITGIAVQIKTVQAEYDSLAGQLASMDTQLVDLESREAAKKAELFERKTLLAERIRDAYDTDRTSLLESFLSGGTFTDVLAEMSYFIDVGEQDQALADGIAGDQALLA